MSVYYLDSSAVAKRYLEESGSAWIRKLCSVRNSETGELFHNVMLGEITRVEVFSAIARRMKAREINEQDAQTIYRVFVTNLEEEYQIVTLTSELIISAAQLARKHAIRANDAIQLALAFHANNLLKENALSLTFVTSDKTLLQAARDEGLAVENPNEY